MQAPLLGQIMVNLGLVTEPQVRTALERQRRESPRRPLGAVMVELGFVSEKSLRGILSAQQRATAAGADGEDPREAVRKRLSGHALVEYARLARELGASDIHLSRGQRPALRIQGRLETLPVDPLDEEAIRAIFFASLQPGDDSRLEAEGSVDTWFEDPEAGRFRIHLFRERGGTAGVLRAIAREAWEFERLGLPDHVRDACRYDHGLVLVTGPVGSGKSTTLASLLQIINRTRKAHVLTVEDPIEVVHRSDQSLFTQRAIGMHASDFATALRGALRKDPDVIVIGEMRDRETTQIALTAAETGHLVLATLHTGTATGTILRILNQFPAEQREHARSLLASVLRCVLCQQLVPSADGESRVLVPEILYVNAAVSALIRDDRIHHIASTMQLCRREGMVTLDDALAALVESGRISAAEAAARSESPERFLVSGGR